ncbi:hypothetical protein CAAN1_09S05424 [[Candida] anglica]|uniref:DUF2421 domain-containing protein n=1 Tax=[Candida] anglica TaxID=148631 RepID=A0ABP0EJT6_9ASCO
MRASANPNRNGGGSYGSTSENGGHGHDDENDQQQQHQDPTKLSFATPTTGRRNQQLKTQASVILAQTGERVQRSVSSFSLGFESFSFRSSDDDTDEENAVESSSLLGRNSGGQIRRQWTQMKEFVHTEMFRNVLKCSLAYLIASLGVYWSTFDDFLGRTDSKHVVATVAVYFHPSRSKGSMHQTLGFVVCAVVFSFSMSFLCRALSGFFFNHGEDELCYTIDLIVSSFTLGVVAFMKQKVNKQTFNTACSLASISLVSCIIKEGSTNASEIPIERLLSTLQVICTGCAISVLICYFVWPVSAVRQLRKHLNDSYNIMSSLLSITANRFLNGENISAKDVEFFNSLNKNITSLNLSLEEAKFELLLVGREEEWLLFVKLVSTTKALARHVQALRSSVEMQWSLLHDQDESDDSTSISSGRHSTESLIHLSQSVENMAKIQTSSGAASAAAAAAVSANTAITSGQIFDLFVYYLAPSMKSFIFTIKNILSEVPFENFDGITNKFAPTDTFQHSLESATRLFQSKQADSFERLYAQEIFRRGDLNDNKDFFFKTDQEEVTACCGNFSSLLGEFSRELMKFLKLTEEYDEARGSSRSWKWLRRRTTTTTDAASEETKSDVDVDLVDSGEQQGLNEALLNFQNHYEDDSKRRKRHQENHSQDDMPLSFKLWKTLKIFNRTDTQFGIRVGLGAFCIAIFAFLPRTKEQFNEWRGEWALVIYCIMMNKSVGGTTMTIKWRFIGTFLGCYGAYLIWWLTDGNGYILCLSGFLISIPSFYIILYWKQNNPFGRFILLAYNLTALYSYSMTQKDTEDGLEGGDNPIIEDIAFHRFVSVSVGIVWALTMASLFLPNSARARLKKGLTILWLRMGVIWNSDPLDYVEEREESRLLGLKDQKGLHDLLRECETLLKQAPKEFRLKGQFPKQKYEKIIQCTSNIIDAFQNMNLMIEVDPALSANEEYVLKYISAERAEVEHRIFLVFYMIASAMRLGFPLPSKPASTEHAKDRMLFKLNEIRSNTAVKKDLTLTNEDYVLLYSYILVTNKISSELDKIILLVKDLLGSINEEIFELV